MLKFLQTPPTGISDLKIIKSGCYGSIFSATYQGEKIAVKFFECDITQPLRYNKVQAAIVSEVEILSFLPPHPSLISFKGVITDGLFMELVDGSDLEAMMDVACHFAFRMSWAEQLAAGLMALAKANIVHADLKRSNVMVNKQGQLKIIDYGLSKKLEDAPWFNSEAGANIYKSPELLFQSHASKQSDIFAMGILLWELHSQIEAWQEIYLYSDFVKVMRNRSRLQFEGLTCHSKTLALITFGLWREKPENRTTAEVAHKQIQDFNVRLATKEPLAYSIIDDIEKLLLKDPSEFWLDVLQDWNKQIVHWMLEDPQFDKKWLLKLNEEQSKLIPEEFRIETIREKSQTPEMIIPTECQENTNAQNCAK